MRKKNAERNWATAQLSCEKKKFVLQPCNCIARERAGKKKYCIAREGCSWTNCIASQGIVLQLGVQVGQELYCNTCIILQLMRA